MLFNSVQFFAFFPIVMLLYILIPQKAKMYWLLVASYFFYMCWNPKYIVLILFTTVVTYIAGLLIGRATGTSGKKFWLVSAIVVNLAVLFTFKYLDFFFLNLNKILSLVGIQAVDKPFDFLLPVGISFYTFQAIGYVVDVYRGDSQAEKNFFKYALFVSFFPQLVAGPIERSGKLIKQIDDLGKRRLWSYKGVVSGLGMMLWGLFVKMVIADRIAIFVDAVHSDIYVAGTIETFIAMLGFSVQIYADFAGYSAVAIGAARIIGIDLMENFNTPLFATSIADFWRRWHISLTTWFRDYIYIPLGGNRRGKLTKYRNIMVTFLISGLWHGASWKYVVWGGIHGVYQIIADIVKPLRDWIDDKLKVQKNVFSYRFGKVLGTNLLVSFALIFFRAGSLTIALKYILRMFTKWNPWVIFNDSLYNWGLNHFEAGILFASLVLLLFVSIVRYKKQLDIGEFLFKQNMVFRWAVFILLLVAIIVFGEYGAEFASNKFIYFDF
ncbi:D-alanyl-lipoteichoic acid acyltransferase DltB, MBOAT superfamily [Lachnospiraceae bacterium YSD2013]|nr:D-alanyl-lipoteichoic acid acyltransferase DltB, MBOAT superfamily [Lachnospiraceae bacterium YSD2013]